MTDYIPYQAARTHELKCWPEPFELIISGRKLFEIRRNDRDYQVGDRLVLNEYFHGQAKYSGRKVTAEVLSVLEGWGLMPDHVCMGLRLVYGSLIENPCADSLTASVRDYLEAVRRDTGVPHAMIGLSGGELRLNLFGDGKPEFGAILTEPLSRQIIKVGTAFVLKTAKRYFLGKE